MNSNLFPAALDTQGVRILTSLEHLMYMGESFHSALTSAIKPLYNSKKFETSEVKALDLSNIIKKFTNMNVTVTIVNGYAAHMYAPPVDNSHPFHNNYFTDVPLFSTAGEMILKGKSDPIAELDYKNAKVGGVYTEIPINVYIGNGFFSNNQFTAEEVAAIMLHEIGHAYTYFLYLGHLYFSNFLISTYAQEIVGTRDVDRRKILIKAAERRLGVEIFNPNKIAEQGSLDKNKMETLFINSHRYALNNTTGTDIYDFRSCEQMADYFATMHGAGPHLITGLNKVYESYGDDSVIPYPIFIIGELFKLILLPITLPFYLLVIMATNPAIKIYDSPGARAKYIELQLKGSLRNRNMDPKMRKALLDSIEAAKTAASEVSDKNGLAHLIWTVLSPSYNRGVNQEKAQKLLENIMFNDLYHKAALFDSIESISPYIDEAVVAVSASREEEFRDEVDLNFNEVNSDIDYLSEIQDKVTETGTISSEQLNNIEAIYAKYKINPRVSIESIRTASTEAIGGLAMAAIAAGLLILIGVIWKIIKWISNDSATSTVPQSTAKTANSVNEGLKVASYVEQNKAMLLDSLNQITKGLDVKSVEHVEKLIREVDVLPMNKGSSQTTPAPAPTKPSPMPTPTASAPAPTPEPTKPTVGYLAIHPGNSIDGIPRSGQDKELKKKPSCMALYLSHVKLDPSIDKQFKLTPKSSLPKLIRYISFFIKKRPIEHVATAITTDDVNYVSAELAKMDAATIAKHIKELNKLGPTLCANVEKLLKITDTNYLKSYLGNTVDGKPYIKQSMMRTGGSKPDLYFLPAIIEQHWATVLKDFQNSYFHFGAFDIKYMGDLYKFEGGVVAIGKSKIIKGLGNGKYEVINESVNNNVVLDEVSSIIKRIESNSSKWKVDIINVFTQVWYGKDADKLGDEPKYQRTVDRLSGAVDQYLTNMVKMLVNYERNVAETLGYINKLNRYGDRVSVFLKASNVLLLDYVNVTN